MRPSRIIPLCLLLLGLMAALARAAPDAGPFDASMQHAVAVAPLQVVTAPTPAPDVFLDANSWPLAVLVILVIITGVLRRVVPAASWPWLHTGQGLWVTSGLAAVATAAAQAVATHGFKPSVLVMAVAQWATSAASMAHSAPFAAEPPPLPPADPTARQTIDRGSLRSLLPLLFLAAMLGACDWSPFEHADVIYGAVVGAVFLAAALLLYRGARRLVFVSVLLVGLTGCGAQWRQANRAHLVADRHSAEVIKAATKAARACVGAGPCLEAALKLIDEQADAVPPVTP